MDSKFKHRLLRAGGWRTVKRIIKPLPVVGAVAALGLAGYELRKKGLLRGSIHVGLDMTPVVGTAKGLVELFTGHLIPDRKPLGRMPSSRRKQRDAKTKQQKREVREQQ